MNYELQAFELPLRKVFNGEFAFKVPFYQRPYSWTREQADELLDDLTTAAEAQPPAPYFLGSIVLVKPAKTVPASDVVDGQQRLTTLTTLLCVLREISDSPERAVGLHQRVWHEDPLDDVPGHCHLTVGRKDIDFFRQNIQARGGLSAFLEPRPDIGKWTDSRKRLWENAERLRSRLKDRSSSDQDRLAKYVVNNCYLVVVATTNRESAYRIFSVLNDRGLPLSPTDILKAEIIGRLPTDAEDRYSQKWEEIEDGLGRERFRDLFTHLRMIRLKSKLRRTLHEDFLENVLGTKPGDGFINGELAPSADVYREILDTRVSDPEAPSWAACIEHLRHLDNFDWIPPAIAYLRSKPRDEHCLRFFQDLERLAYFLFVTRAYQTQRINRYAEVLKELDDGGDLAGDRSRLQLSRDELEAFLQRLGQDIYSRGSRVMRPLLQKLDSTFLEPHGGATYDRGITTVEHVLPQTPPEGSEWRRWFTDEEREEWTHKLANLVLLSRRRNTAASNRPFREKIDTYLLDKEGHTPFLLTQSIKDESEWTPEVLKQRQRKLVGRLSAVWRLQEPASGGAS